MVTGTMTGSWAYIARSPSIRIVKHLNYFDCKSNDMPQVYVCIIFFFCFCFANETICSISVVVYNVAKCVCMHMDIHDPLIYTTTKTCTLQSSFLEVTSVFFVLLNPIQFKHVHPVCVCCLYIQEEEEKKEKKKENRR